MNSKPVVLPLETLILKLEAEGFKIGVDTRINLQKVLKEFGKDFSNRPQDLKQIICPIVAKNSKDQDKFNDVFDRYFSETREESEKKSEELNKDKIKSEPRDKTAMSPFAEFKKSEKMAFSVIFGIILILTVTIPFISNPGRNCTTPKPTFRLDSQDGNIVKFENTTIGKDSLIFEWDFGDDSEPLKSNQNSLSHNYNKNGQYKVFLKATAFKDC